MEKALSLLLDIIMGHEHEVHMLHTLMTGPIPILSGLTHREHSLVSSRAELQAETNGWIWDGGSEANICHEKGGVANMHVLWASLNIEQGSCFLQSGSPAYTLKQQAPTQISQHCED